MISHALVIGDNRTSASILREITANAFRVSHIIVSKSAPEVTDGIHQYPSNLSASSLSQIFAECCPEVIISTQAGGAFETQKRIIDCAIEADIPRFIAAEFEHDSLNAGVQERLPPHRERARVIEYLQGLADKDRISWCAVATGCVLDHGLISGDLGVDLKWQSATLHGNGDEKFAASSQAWIGRVVLGMIQHWEKVQNKYCYAAGLVTTMNTVLEGLQQSTGEKWEVGKGDVEECIHEGESRIRMGFPDAGMFLLQRSILYDQSLEATGPFVQNDCKALLDLQGERLEDIIEHVVHEHKHHGKGDCGCS